jgi:hypothetical protein
MLGHRAEHRRLRTDLVAVTGVSLLVVALAVAAVLSIVVGGADDRNERLVTDLVGVDGQDGKAERSTGGADLGR